ncbi:F0F1 ATP synthase subunit delta [Micavibrio aeruginosavorus]|uniref:ATP synthase subunit delta n=1 Tax=Micavibrio aeruginosavorus EPB TaxID=349215 RepID=M4VDW6_9BACT|nr:F0F1 ATP synthase subunit delta [Micavibrio aeruginosavorus]AGH97413.1 ATP synthase delta chain [Micavibrio aeruginosavorus EPB]
MATQTSQVASRYAVSLLDMAGDAGSVEQVEKDLNALAGMIAASDDLQKLIKNPLFNRTQHQRAILAVADKAGFSDLTRRFLGVLAGNRRLGIISGVIQAFGNELARRRGTVSARVQSAFVLSPVQTDALQKALSDKMGQNVTLNVEIDKSLLGGMVVTVGSVMIDNSVKRKLERLKRAMESRSAA